MIRANLYEIILGANFLALLLGLIVWFLPCWIKCPPVSGILFHWRSFPASWDVWRFPTLYSKWMTTFKNWPKRRNYTLRNHRKVCVLSIVVWSEDSVGIIVGSLLLGRKDSKHLLLPWMNDAFDSIIYLGKEKARVDSNYLSLILEIPMVLNFVASGCCFVRHCTNNTQVHSVYLYRRMQMLVRYSYCRHA